MLVDLSKKHFSRNRFKYLVRVPPAGISRNIDTAGVEVGSWRSSEVIDFKRRLCLKGDALRFPFATLVSSVFLNLATSHHKNG